MQDQDPDPESLCRVPIPTIEQVINMVSWLKTCTEQTLVKVMAQCIFDDSAPKVIDRNIFSRSSFFREMILLNNRGPAWQVDVDV